MMSCEFILTGGGKKRKSRKQTGDGLWSGLKEIFQ